MVHITLIDAQSLGTMHRVVSGAYFSGLYAGSGFTIAELEDSYITSTMPSVCHSVKSFHFMNHMGVSCLLIRPISSTSLIRLGYCMRTKSSSMESPSILSVLWSICET